VKDLCRRHGFSEASYYLWRSRFVDMTLSDAKRLKALEQEVPISRSYWEGAAGAGGDPGGAPKKVVDAPPRRELVRWMCGDGLTERCALRVWA
jgi:hypothetical protein